VKSNRYIKCPDKIYQPRHESDDKGRDEMGNKDVHTFLTKRGVSPGNSPCVDIVTMQDWGDVTCKDEQRMGGADDSSWGWL
jgi:hypothetical protein